MTLQPCCPELLGMCNLGLFTVSVWNDQKGTRTDTT